MGKKILIYIIVISGSLLIFGTGFYLGGSYCNSFSNDSLIKNQFQKYLDSFVLLNLLEDEELEKARELLLTEQDIAILLVDNIANPRNKESYELANTYMRLVYKHRKSNKQKYIAYINTNEPKKRDLRQQAQGILEKWNKQDELGKKGRCLEIVATHGGNPRNPLGSGSGMTFCLSHRLQKTDGPRTDVQDVTTYAYAPVTGFITSVTWPIIGTTSYSDHDPWATPVIIGVRLGRFYS